jgi:signal transduction histidine kinase
MARVRITSLRQLLLTHELTFLLLVAVTGVLGGLWGYFWQRTTVESVRLHSLYYAAQQIRGDLFRQIKQVYLARLLEEETALNAYNEYRRQINENFNSLRRNSQTRVEQEAIQSMQQAYRVLQQDMNKAFTDPYMLNRVVRIRILDPREEKDVIAEFESAFSRFEALIKDHEVRLGASMARWNRIAPIAIPIPIVLAVVLLAVSRRSLQKDFVHPMAGILAGARRMSDGALTDRIAEIGVAETVDLAQAINAMATKLDASQAALVESEKQAALGALVPVIAHNIRNPLAAIRATAQLIAPGDRAEELAETRSAIIATVDRLGRWVTALVSYLHPLKPHRVLTRPQTLFEAALGLLAPRLAERGIVVERRGWEAEVEIEADVDLVEQALYALLSNAADASPERAVLTVALTVAPATVTFQVSDQGPGMPFQPEAASLAPGPTTKRFGTGLGIPVAYKVFRTLGWQLEFNSRSGGGTDVIVTAPRRQDPAGTGA